MSTRSMIATVTGDHLSGRYHHSDGYPTGLGAQLLRLRREEYPGPDGLLAMRSYLLEEHPAGWSNIWDKRCYCHWEGREEAGTPMMECRCGSGDNSKCDPLFMEWMYVLNASGIGVWAAIPTGPSVDSYRHVEIRTVPWDAPELEMALAEQEGSTRFSAAWSLYKTT